MTHRAYLNDIPVVGEVTWHKGIPTSSGIQGTLAPANVSDWEAARALDGCEAVYSGPVERRRGDEVLRVIVQVDPANADALQISAKPPVEWYPPVPPSREISWNRE